MGLASFAQPAYNLEIERGVTDSLLKLELYIRNTSAKPFLLGGSDFLVDITSSGLDLKNARFLPGEFDQRTNPGYEKTGTGIDQLLILNVRADVSNGFQGKSIAVGSKSKIGSIEIPVTNPCNTVNPVWVKEGVVQSYSKGAKAENITKGANYVNALPIDLDGGISKTVPLVSMASGKLISSSINNNQWFLDNIAIPGANKKEYTPLVEGNYAVQVVYPCAKNFSLSLPVIITGLKEFTTAYSFHAQPNPFVGECKVKYSLLNAANIKLQVYDISGTHILDIENGLKSQGEHELVFKPVSYQLNAGSYILKLAIDDKVGTIKLVALK